MAHVRWVIFYLVWIFTVRDDNGNLGKLPIYREGVESSQSNSHASCILSSSSLPDAPYWRLGLDDSVHKSQDLQDDHGNSVQADLQQLPPFLLDSTGEVPVFESCAGLRMSKRQMCFPRNAFRHVA